MSKKTAQLLPHVYSAYLICHAGMAAFCMLKATSSYGKFDFAFETAQAFAICII